MVRSLCSIHNFLIDQNEKVDLTHTATDTIDMFTNGAFTVQHESRSNRGGEVVTIPDPLLLHGDKHIIFMSEHQHNNNCPSY